LLDQIDKAANEIPDQWDIELTTGRYVFKIPDATLYKVSDLAKFKKRVLAGFKGTGSASYPEYRTTAAGAIKRFLLDGEIENADNIRALK